MAKSGITVTEVDLMLMRGGYPTSFTMKRKDLANELWKTAEKMVAMTEDALEEERVRIFKRLKETGALLVPDDKLRKIVWE